MLDSQAKLDRRGDEIIFSNVSSYDLDFCFCTYCLAFAIPYRDASQYVVDGYKLGLISCFASLYKGKQLGWIDIDTFDYEEYKSPPLLR